MSTPVATASIIPQFIDFADNQGFRKLIDGKAQQLAYLDISANLSTLVTAPAAPNPEPCYMFNMAGPISDTHPTDLMISPNPSASSRPECNTNWLMLNGTLSPPTTPVSPGLDTCAVSNKDGPFGSNLGACKVGFHVYGGGNMQTANIQPIPVGSTDDGNTWTSKTSSKFMYVRAYTGQAGTLPQRGKLCAQIDTHGNITNVSNRKVTSIDPVVRTFTSPDGSYYIPSVNSFDSGNSSYCGEGIRSDLSGKHRSYLQTGPVILDEKNAMACCSWKCNGPGGQCTSDTDPDFMAVCAGTNFDPTGSVNVCSELFQNYCRNHWGDYVTQPGIQCNNFINNVNSTNSLAVSDTLINYIASDTRCGPSSGGMFPDGTVADPSIPGSCPQDYVSYNLRDVPGTPSQMYYDYHQCPANYTATGCNSMSTYSIDSPCCRDDSRDPFFRTAVPQMCGAQPSACVQPLRYFCASMSRSDLNDSQGGNGDPTLSNMCGCFMYNGVEVDAPMSQQPSRQMNMTAPPQPSTVYYTGSIVGTTSCDPMCRTAAIQNNSQGWGQCNSPTCVIDNVSITNVNSNVGNVNVNQTCGGASQCYISNAAITSINSNVGGVDISQNCSSGECYEYTNTPGDGYPIDCTTRLPLQTTPPDNGNGNGGGSPPPPSGGNGGGSPPPSGGNGGNPPAVGGTPSKKGGFWQWVKDHTLWFVILLMAAIGLLIFAFSSFHGSKPKSDMLDVGGEVYSDPYSG